MKSPSKRFVTVIVLSVGGLVLSAVAGTVFTFVRSFQTRETLPPAVATYLRGSDLERELGAPVAVEAFEPANVKVDNLVLEVGFLARARGASGEVEIMGKASAPLGVSWTVHDVKYGPSVTQRNAEYRRLGFSFY